MLEGMPPMSLPIAMLMHACSCGQEDRQLLASLQTGEGGAADLHVVQLLAHQHALELWEPLCKDKQPSKAPLLLLPPEFEFLDAQSGPHELQNLAKIGAQVLLAWPSGASVGPFRLHLCLTSPQLVQRWPLATGSALAS